MTKNLEPIKSKNLIIGEHWAIIIGISKYKYSSLNLKFAHRDAEELYKLLTESKSGFFKKDNIIKLINKDATQSKIIKALRYFLKKPDKNDLVVIYFSCHGAYDPDRPKNSYILPYDTDPNDIASTAVPMREIESSIYDNLLSEKIIIIADACHSAAIGTGNKGRRNIKSTPIINKYLKNLANSIQGTALITSAEANEVAFENKKWGEGHGVFTHFLLEGLRGNADGYGGEKKDGIISIGELFEYVRDNVKQSTENRQHPSIGSYRYDRDLPLSIISKNVNDSNKITIVPTAQLPYGIDFWNPTGFNYTHRRFTYYLLEGITGKAFDTTNGEITMMSLLNYIKQKLTEEGYGDNFISADINEVTNLDAIKFPISFQNNKICISNCIGIGEYQDIRIPPLFEAENDARKLFELLTSQKVGFQNNPQNLLLGHKATQRNIVKRISEITRFYEKLEMVLFYFTGHGVFDENENIYLATYDVEPEDPYVGGIKLTDLKEKLYSSRNIKNVVIIIDCVYSGVLESFAK